MPAMTSAAVGVGVAGFIDFHSGEIIRSPNLPWLNHTHPESDLQRTHFHAVDG